MILECFVLYFIFFEGLSFVEILLCNQNILKKKNKWNKTTRILYILYMNRIMNKGDQRLQTMQVKTVWSFIMSNDYMVTYVHFRLLSV